jgi:hypothetical protein
MAETVPPASSAYEAFLRSMSINADRWRDGIGYDLQALAGMTESERDSIAGLLVGRLAGQGDWRDVQALGAIATPQAIEALRRGADGARPEIRAHCAQQLAAIGEPVDMDAVIAGALRNTRLHGGFDAALQLAERHPTPHVRETLLDLALNGADSEIRVACAAMALFLGGKADSPYDWNHRQLFLRFAEDDRAARLAAHRELCRMFE